MAYSDNKWDAATAGRVDPKQIARDKEQQALAKQQRARKVQLLSVAMTEAITNHPLFQIAFTATKAVDDLTLLMDAFDETKSIAKQGLEEARLMNMPTPKGLPS